jgi:acetoin utilization protein AcuB
MIAKNIIRTTIAPLKTTDTGDFALQQMAEFHVRHLPIVENEQFIGLIAEDDIFHFDIDDEIGSFGLALSRPFVKENTHFYEVMQKMAEFRLTVIPIVGENERYEGAVVLEDLLFAFADSTSVSDYGSIIVLEAAPHDYSFAEIGRIVEAEGAMILSTFTRTNPDDGMLEITLKINSMEVSGIIATLNRFDYEIKGAFSVSDYVEELQEHYDSLMSYLNV